MVASFALEVLKIMYHISIDAEKTRRYKIFTIQEFSHHYSAHKKQKILAKIEEFIIYFLVS